MGIKDQIREAIWQLERNNVERARRILESSIHTPLPVSMRWSIRNVSGKFINTKGGVAKHEAYRLVYASTTGMLAGLPYRSGSNYRRKPDYLKGTMIVSTVGHEIPYEDLVLSYWQAQWGHLKQSRHSFIEFEDGTVVNSEDRDQDYLAKLIDIWKEHEKKK